MRQRNRGYFLTNKGWNKIWGAINHEFPDGYNLADIAALTETGGSVSTDTISNIINRSERGDKTKIESLFQAFKLTVESDDLTRDVPIKPVKVDDPNFIGRESAIASLENLINKGAKTILIQGIGGVGKTTLAQKYLKNKFKTILEFPIAKETKNIASVESLLQEKLRQLGEEPGQEFIVSLDRLKQKLQTEKIGILIDNLEPALDASGQFIPEHRSYIELLRVLSDSSVKSITIITSRERLCEGLDIALYSLPCLTVETWYEYWHYQGINPDIMILIEIHKAYGGNALAMKVLCNPILNNEFKGDVVAYWQENKTEDNLEVETVVANLIKEQFERLAKINLDAYNLLCRLGCYRYQDQYVSTVSEKGLFCLLWDVVENQHKRIIRTLKERALVDFNRGDYSLHPVIRKEAIERLKKSEDWEKANIQAAEFWTESITRVETVKDALTAFEAYYHYINIDYFEQAADIIIKDVNAKWEEDIAPIGSLLNRSYIIQKNIDNIVYLLNKINSKFYLIRLYHILGNLYLFTGNPQKSLYCYNKALEYIDTTLAESKDKKILLIYIYCILNKGFCKIQLGEIKYALTDFEIASKLSQENNYITLIAWSFGGLAFLNSCLEAKDKAYFFAEKAYDYILYNNLRGWVKAWVWIGLGLAYNNLGETKKSIQIYEEVIQITEENNYSQALGKALTGLAEVYRKEEKFKDALSSHFKSIELLHKIGDKCDLALSYYQLGLTYQKMGKIENRNHNFNEAIQIFQQMEAPKQVEKVKRAIIKQ